jgi:glycosyltransferase involved in cell wall biosynthesis
VKRKGGRDRLQPKSVGSHENIHVESKILLIAWAPSSARLSELAQVVGGKVFFLSVLFGRKWAAPLRYLLLSLETFWVLRRERPSIVVAQNPPIFLPLSLLFVKHLMKFKLAVDNHAIWSLKTIREPILSQAINFFEKFVVKRTDLNCSANEKWTQELQLMGAKAAITFHDFVPPLRESVATKVNAEGIERLSLPEHNFLVIASHGGHPQELLELEIEAIKQLKDSVLVITGKREKLAKRLAKLSLPPNVVYAGFLEEKDYAALKKNADAALALSREPNTVSHALHEFLSHKLPSIVLKDDLLNSLFDSSIVEVEDTNPTSVASVLQKVLKDDLFRSTVKQNIERNYLKRYEAHKREVVTLTKALLSLDAMNFHTG